MQVLHAYLNIQWGPKAQTLEKKIGKHQVLRFFFLNDMQK